MMIPPMMTFGTNSLHLNKHTTIKNISKIVIEPWMQQLLVFDPLVIKEVPFKPLFNQRHSQNSSYFTLFIIIIIIMV